jgi:hypothetical protein
MKVVNHIKCKSYAIVHDLKQNFTEYWLLNIDSFDVNKLPDTQM